MEMSAMSAYSSIPAPRRVRTRTGNRRGAGVIKAFTNPQRASGADPMRAVDLRTDFLEIGM
jgi:hypothetical protein